MIGGMGFKGVPWGGIEVVLHKYMNGTPSFKATSPHKKYSRSGIENNLENRVDFHFQLNLDLAFTSSLLLKPS